MHDQLVNVLIYLAAAVVAVPLFERFRLGAILGYLAAGIAIGPHGVNAIADPEQALQLAELGVVLLLFIIGLELSPTVLWRMRTLIAAVGSVQLLGTAAVVGGLVFLATDRPLSVAAMIGLAVALSSTAFAVQLMTSYRIFNTQLGQKGFAILLLQDMAVIPILLFVAALAGPGASNGPPWWVGMGTLIGVLVAGRFLLNPLLRLVANNGNTELMTAAALLIVLGTALLVEAAGLSMGMGAFMAGVLLANSSFKHQLETEIDPFKGLLLGLFFIAIGMMLDIDLLLQSPLLIIGLASVLIVVKAGIIAGLAKVSGSTLHDSVRLGLMLSQGGEFAFVVMTFAISASVIDGNTANTVSLVVGISMALTSPLLLLYNRLVVTTADSGRPYDSQWSESEPEVLIAGFGRVGQITGRILAANNIPFTALDRNADHIEFVRRFGNKVFFGDATRLDLLETAGIRHAKVLLIAVDDEEDALEIIELARQECPNIRIVSRAHNRVNLLRQMRAGANASIRELFGSSVDMAVEVLKGMDFGDEKAHNLSHLFELHDRSLIEEALKHPIEIEKLIEIGVQGRLELEQLFSQDRGNLD